MALRRYLGVIEPMLSNDGWAISFPAFPGVTSAGNTIPQVLANAQDVLETVIGVMEQDDLAIPHDDDPKPGTLGFDPADYHQPIVAMVTVNAAVELPTPA